MIVGIIDTSSHSSRRNGDRHEADPLVGACPLPSSCAPTCWLKTKSRRRRKSRLSAFLKASMLPRPRSWRKPGWRASRRTPTRWRRSGRSGRRTARCWTRSPPRSRWATPTPRSCWPRPGTPTTPAPTEVPAMLKDKKKPAFFRNNLALAYGKALTMRKVYEEALEAFARGQGRGRGRPGGVLLPQGGLRARPDAQGQGRRAASTGCWWT